MKSTPMQYPRRRKSSSDRANNSSPDEPQDKPEGGLIDDGSGGEGNGGRGNGNGGEGGAEGGGKARGGVRKVRRGKAGRGKGGGRGKAGGGSKAMAIKPAPVLPMLSRPGSPMAKVAKLSPGKSRAAAAIKRLKRAGG